MFTFFFVLFGFPETKWHRVHPDEMRAREAAGSYSPSSSEKINYGMSEKKEVLEEVDTNMANLTHTVTSERDPYLGKGSPSKGQWKLFQSNASPLKTIIMDIWIPIKLFAFPIVEFASFVVSWSASSFLTLNLTQSQVFAAPPYEFSPLVIGFFNFAVLVGAIIGLLTAGPLSDWISMKLTKRNKGIREPEMRLPTMIPYVLIMMLGNFIVAFGYQNGWSWKVSSPYNMPQPCPVTFPY